MKKNLACVGIVSNQLSFISMPYLSTRYGQNTSNGTVNNYVIKVHHQLTTIFGGVCVFLVAVVIFKRFAGPRCLRGLSIDCTYLRYLHKMIQSYVCFSQKVSVFFTHLKECFLNRTFSIAISSNGKRDSYQTILELRAKIRITQKRFGNF